MRKIKIKDEEFDLICKYIKLRNESNISQSELARKVVVARSTIARMGSSAAKAARDSIEKNLGKAVISNKNSLKYKYIEENKKQIDNK